MSWKKFAREDRIRGSDKPFIAISRSHIAFSSKFVREAGIGPEMRVTVYVDEENGRLGFGFDSQETPDSFALSMQSSHKRGEKRKGMQCTSRSLIMRYPWVKGVTERPTKERRFTPKRDGDLWVIELLPPRNSK